MAAVVLPAWSRFAKALREPNLLVPGKKSVGPIHVKQPNNKFSCVWPLKAGDYLRDWTGTKPLTNTLVDLSDDKATWNNTTNQRLTATRNVHADQFSLLIQFTQTVADGAGLFQQHISGSEWPILVWITVAGDLKFLIRNASSVNVIVTVVTGFSTSYLGKKVTLGVKYDGANIKAYLDGQFMASASQTGNIKASALDYAIGNYLSASGWVFPLTGSIELVALETTQAVSDEQLRQYTKDPWGELFKPANDAPFIYPISMGGITLSVNGALHSHTSDQPILTQAHSLTANDATHDHSAEQPSLSTAVDVTPADADHAHAAEQPSLVQQHILGPDDAAHAHLADQPALVQQHVLVVAEATHNHTADNVALTVAGTLAVADALHGHTADQPVLTQAHQLAPDDADHGHTVGQPALTQAHVLLAADALHGHTAGQPALDLSVTLAPSDAAHAQLADSPILTQAHLLAVQDALHAHYADSPTLPIHVTLVASDALHAHLADNAAVIVGTLETPAGRVYLVESRVTAYRADSPVAAHLIH